MPTSPESGYIDLGSKPEAMDAMPMKSSDPKVYYPSLHFSSDSPHGLPEEGTAMIKFKLGSVTMTKRDGKSRYSCDIEVMGIKPVGAEKKSGGLGKALDKIASKKMSGGDAEDAADGNDDEEEEGEY